MRSARTTLLSPLNNLSLFETINHRLYKEIEKTKYRIEKREIDKFINNNSQYNCQESTINIIHIIHIIFHSPFGYINNIINHYSSSYFTINKQIKYIFSKKLNKLISPNMILR